MINFAAMSSLVRLWLLVIELGDFQLKSVTPLREVIWFIIGFLILAGSSAVVLWWHRRDRPDPFL